MESIHFSFRSQAVQDSHSSWTAWPLKM